jgi:hypothetical protein
MGSGPTLALALSPIPNRAWRTRSASSRAQSEAESRGSLETTVTAMWTEKSTTERTGTQEPFGERSSKPKQRLAAMIASTTPE